MVASRCLKRACFHYAVVSIPALNTASDLESDRAFVPARSHSARINPFLIPAVCVAAGQWDVGQFVNTDVSIAISSLNAWYKCMSYFLLYAYIITMLLSL